MAVPQHASPHTPRRAGAALLLASLQRFSRIASVVLVTWISLTAPALATAQERLPSSATVPAEDTSAASPAARLAPVPSFDDPTSILPSAATFQTFVIGMIVGFFLALARLIGRFYRFWGVGMVMNVYSFAFLAVLTVLSGGSCLAVSSAHLMAPVSEGLDRLLAMLGAPVLANVSTVLGRLPRKRGSESGTVAGVKDLDAVKSANFVFELVRYAIAERLDREVEVMARKYDWVAIQDMATRLVENEMAMGTIVTKDGDEALAFVASFQASADLRLDVNNKYKALHRVIRVTSFYQLRSRLAHLQPAAPAVVL
jgi:hypothetical protein